MVSGDCLLLSPDSDPKHSDRSVLVLSPGLTVKELPEVMQQANATISSSNLLRTQVGEGPMFSGSPGAYCPRDRGEWVLFTRLGFLDLIPIK